MSSGWTFIFRKYYDGRPSEAHFVLIDLEYTSHQPELLPIIRDAKLQSFIG